MRTTRTTDRGNVLPMVMVLVLVLGSLGAFISYYVGTALRAGNVTDSRVDRLEAADSGMQLALERLDNGNCSPITQTVINGAVVTSTCTNITQVEDSDGAYALVVTGETVTAGTPALDTSAGAQGVNGLKRLSGPVYLGEGITTDIGNTAAVVPDPWLGIDVGGEVRYDVVGDCPGTGAVPVTAAMFQAPTPTIRCDSRGWAQVSPQPTLPTVPSVAMALAPESSATCKVYSPGYLTNSSLELDSSTFFKPGVYQFTNVALKFTGPVLVGYEASKSRIPSGCAAVAAANSGGAVWVFSGSTTLLVDKGDLDFHAKMLGPTGKQRSVSIIALATADGGFAASTVNANTTVLIDRKNPTQSNYSFSGLVWVPHGWVSTGSSTTSGDAIVQFSGGLTVARATIETAANVEGFSISVGTGIMRYSLIEVTAVKGGTTKVRTVSRHPTTGLQVLSWRVSQV